MAPAAVLAQAPGVNAGRSDIPTTWDEEQTQVIQAPASARLLVDAGPGMGKTAVACARVASLVNSRTDPGGIWMISFTRTAVREIRNRIGAYLPQEVTDAVKISTLDSHSWYILNGFRPSADGKSVFRSYDQNIDETCELLKSRDEDLLEYLGSARHLIVDEAQDLVGRRAALVEALLAVLPSDCGVTVFTDDAQSIYGFTRDDNGDGGIEEDHENLSRRLRRDLASNRFRPVELKTLYRTDSKTLRRLFEQARPQALPGGPAVGAERLAKVRQSVEANNDGTLEDVTKQALQNGDQSGTLVLFRRRSDVLQASSFLLPQTAHRLRLSGFPACIRPWVGLVLGDHIAPHLTRSQFDSRWEDEVRGTPEENVPREAAWALLWRTAGDAPNRIDCRNLRRRLSGAQPPIDFCYPEIGTRGPILGTIHASKGREADVVHLMLPRVVDSGEDKTEIGESDAERLDEEARVVFVGATRARRTLRVGKGYAWAGSQLSGSHRAYKLQLSGGQLASQVELGRAGDLDEPSLASHDLYATVGEVRSAQQHLMKAIEKPFSMTAEASFDTGWVYRLDPAEGQALLLGTLDKERVNRDLFSIGKVIQERRPGAKLRPSLRLKHINCVGVRTVVLPPEKLAGLELHSPWNQSGIFLAPVLAAFTMVYFNRYKG